MHIRLQNSTLDSKEGQIVYVDGDNNHNVLLVDTNTPNGPHNKAYKVGQTAGNSSTYYANMPTELQGATCILYRSVLCANAGHIVVKMEEAWPTPGRQWYNFYNVSAWRGWKCITPN